MGCVARRAEMMVMGPSPKERAPLNAQTDRLNDSPPTDETALHALYGQLLDAWNKRNAERFAALFEESGSSIGFDGSPLEGRGEIAATIGQIFADHQTAAYVAKVRAVRFLGPDVAVLRAVAGLVPPGQSDINPDVNAMQTLVAARRNGRWQIALFQNTPAQFHGRPAMAQALTDELRQLL